MTYFLHTETQTAQASVELLAHFIIESTLNRQNVWENECFRWNYTNHTLNVISSLPQTYHYNKKMWSGMRSLNSKVNSHLQLHSVCCCSSNAVHSYSISSASAWWIEISIELEQQAYSCIAFSYSVTNWRISIIITDTIEMKCAELLLFTIVR